MEGKKKTLVLEWGFFLAFESHETKHKRAYTKVLVNNLYPSQCPPSRTSKVLQEISQWMNYTNQDEGEGEAMLVRVFD